MSNASNYSGESLTDLLQKAIRALRSSKHDEAIYITDEIIERQADHASAYAIQFSSLFKSKRLEHARRIGTQAAKLNPDSVFILNNQACLQLEAKQPAAAAGLLKSLIDQFGERGQWLYNLALAQRMVGNCDYSIKMFRRTLDHQPKHDLAAFQLADCLRVIGHHEEAVRAYDYLRLLRSNHAPSFSNYIHNATVNGLLTKTDFEQELNLWQDRFVPKDKHYLCDPPQNNEQLNIAFLIGVLPKDWLLYIVTPVINQLAKANDSITVYWHDEKPSIGLFNERVKVLTSHKLSDADFARQVREDKIDALIDVCGMRLGSRQRSLSLQLAYKQWGWLAHEGAYAVPTVAIIDRKLGKHRFFVNEPIASQAALPEKTFWGIGSQHGLSYQVIKAWAQIMRLTPQWSLHFDAKDDDVTKLLISRFAELGVSKERLNFNPRLRPGMNSIVLDNFVENDPVAACSAISAGAILVALKGTLFPAMQTTALLHQFNRDEWLCSTQYDYIQKAISMSTGEQNNYPVDASELHESRVNNLGAFVANFRRVFM